MTFEEQIANAIAASFSYATDTSEPMVIGEERARRAAQAVSNLFWFLASPTTWNGQRGRSLFMQRGDGKG